MLAIVRHGETELNAARIFQPEDTPLSARGMEQAQFLGERMSRMRVVKVISSDLPRTKQTAKAIYDRLMKSDVPYIENPILRERSFGDYIGQSIDHVMNTPGVDLFAEHHEVPNGESWPVFHARAKRAWDWVVEEAKKVIKTSEDIVVVVTHGLVLTSFARKIWHVIPKEAFHNTSVSFVRRWIPGAQGEEHAALERLNCFEHLPERLVGTQVLVRKGSSDSVKGEEKKPGASGGGVPPATAPSRV